MPIKYARSKHEYHVYGADHIVTRSRLIVPDRTIVSDQHRSYNRRGCFCISESVFFFIRFHHHCGLLFHLDLRFFASPRARESDADYIVIGGSIDLLLNA